MVLMLNVIYINFKYILLSWNTIKKYFGDNKIDLKIAINTLYIFLELKQDKRTLSEFLK